MHDPVLDRPLFQTPVRRESSGIMAGVAPVNMANGGFLERVGRTGDLAIDLATEDPGSMVSEDFWSLEQTPEGSGMNLRDLTDIVFDPDDRLDQATLALVVFPPALAAARLAKMGLTGVKLANQLSKIVKVQNRLGGSGRLATLGQIETGRMLPELPELGSAIKEFHEVANLPEDEWDIEEEEFSPEEREMAIEMFGEDRVAASGMAEGGIASFASGGKAGKGAKGIRALTAKQKARRRAAREAAKKAAKEAEIAAAEAEKAAKEVLALTPGGRATAIPKPPKPPKPSTKPSKAKKKEEKPSKAKKKEEKPPVKVPDKKPVAAIPAPPKPPKPSTPAKPTKKKVAKEEKPPAKAPDEGPVSGGDKPSGGVPWKTLGLGAAGLGTWYATRDDEDAASAGAAPLTKEERDSVRGGVVNQEAIEAEVAAADAKEDDKSARISRLIDDYDKKQKEVTAKPPPATKKWWQRGILGNIDEALSGIDPRARAGLIAGGTATEGFTPTNWAQRFQAGTRAYDKEQREVAESAAKVAGAQPAIKQQYDFLRSSAVPEVIAIDPFSGEVLEVAREETQREVDYRVWTELFKRQEQAGKLEMLLEMFETLGVANVTKQQLEELLQDTVKTEEFMRGIFGTTATSVP